MTVIRSGSATDVGRVRASNEDRVLATLTLFAVADGMGGHAGGEVASTIASETLQSVFDRQPSSQGLVRAAREANLAVWQRSQIDIDLRGMGTTLAAAALVSVEGSDRLALVNVGDSRIYLWRSGRLVQLSADHSVAEELVLRGELTSAEAAVHPHRHILTRALGISEEVEVDAWEILPLEGDRYLLCSDGLCNEVIDEQIAQVLAALPDPQPAAERLVQMALDHGGNDNVSVVLIAVLVGDATPASDVLATGRAGSLPAVPAEPALVVRSQVPPHPAPPDFLISSTARSGDPISVVPPVRMSRTPGHPLLAVSRRRHRLVTFRTLLFALLLVALFAGPWLLVRWYVSNSYFVGVGDNQIVIYQGRPGGFLWYQPKVVDRTHVEVGSIEQYQVVTLRAGVEEPSLAQARTYVANLVQAAGSLQQASTTTPPSTSPNSTRSLRIAPTSPSGMTATSGDT